MEINVHIVIFPMTRCGSMAMPRCSSGLKRARRSTSEFSSSLRQKTLILGEGKGQERGDGDYFFDV